LTAAIAGNNSYPFAASAGVRSFATALGNGVGGSDEKRGNAMSSIGSGFGLRASVRSMSDDAVLPVAPTSNHPHVDTPGMSGRLIYTETSCIGHV